MIPSPMKPTSIISIFLIRARLCVDYLCRVPSEAFGGGGLRLVFAANPAAISDLVEIAKQEGIVDLSGARFVAAGIIGQLDMRDTGEMFLQGSRQIALHHLHVVNVILNKEIIGADIGDDLKGLFCPAQEKTGNVERVDRLNQEANTLPDKGVCRESQILEKHLI